MLESQNNLSQVQQLQFKHLLPAERKQPLCYFFCLVSGLLDLLKEEIQGEYSVHIGPECGIDCLSDLSVVTAYYDVGHGHRGTLGIVGPLRMPYFKVLNTLKVAGQALSELLAAGNNN